MQFDDCDFVLKNLQSCKLLLITSKVWQNVLSYYEYIDSTSVSGVFNNKLL